MITIVYSCTEEFPDSPSGNSPPNTGLFLYPDSTIAQQPSRLRVSWWGDDSDGLVLGFYFKWEGIDAKWNFTASNDSIFSLPIGTSDTTYNFLVAAVDAEGNGKYDNEIFQNGISYGPEPFIDRNNNGNYDEGEFYYDVGLIDPSPASLQFPIKNTPPVLTWNELSFLPDTSFPVITISWNATDLDGDESITKIRIALNDTSNFVELNGAVRLVTLRGVNLQSSNPEFEILINGSTQDILPDKLQNIQLDAINKLFLQALDISGASSEVIELPDTSSNWYVKKPKGEVLIVDDFTSGSSDLQARDFYNQAFSTISGGALAGKFDVFDLANNPLPFETVTFQETIKLFKYIFWYSASNPRLGLLNIVTNKFLQSGGKIAFSMTFQDSSSTYEYDLSSLQGFLPVDSTSKKLSNGFLLAGAKAQPTSVDNYPQLETSITISFVRAVYSNPITSENLYNLYDRTGLFLGPIGFRTTIKNLFFIGLPLHQSNVGTPNVNSLLEKVFFDDFGLMP